MGDKEYAGFWIRFGAVLIDVLILAVLLVIPLSLIYGESYWTEDKLLFGFWDFIITYVIPFLVTIWFWLRFLGTPGKMATKLEIVDATTGDKMTTGQAIGRYFAYLISALPFCLGYLWVAFDKRQQSWHDKLANTVVVRNKTKEPVRFAESSEERGG